MMTGDSSNNGGIWLDSGAKLFIGEAGTQGNGGFWTSGSGWALQVDQNSNITLETNKYIYWGDTNHYIGGFGAGSNTMYLGTYNGAFSFYNTNGSYGVTLTASNYLNGLVNYGLQVGGYLSASTLIGSNIYSLNGIGLSSATGASPSCIEAPGNNYYHQLCLQSDGNLVWEWYVNGSWVAKWSSGTTGG